MADDDASTVIHRLRIVHQRMFAAAYTDVTVEMLRGQSKRLAVALGVARGTTHDRPLICQHAPECLENVTRRFPVLAWILYHVTRALFSLSRHIDLLVRSFFLCPLTCRLCRTSRDARGVWLCLVPRRWDGVAKARPC